MKTFPAGHWKPGDLLEEEFWVDVAKAEGERRHIASLPASRARPALKTQTFFVNSGTVSKRSATRP